MVFGLHACLVATEPERCQVGAQLASGRSLSTPLRWKEPKAKTSGLPTPRNKASNSAAASAAGGAHRGDEVLPRRFEVAAGLRRLGDGDAELRQHAASGGASHRRASRP
jgi:hypothetical protein